MKRRIKDFFKKIRIINEPYQKMKIRMRNIRLHKRGYKVLGTICKELKEENLEVYCDYGTLLGFIRDNGFIAHDLDIDMGIVYNKSFSWKRIDEIAKKCGMFLDHQFTLEGTGITEKTYIKKGVSIDFFIHYPNENEMLAYVYGSNDEKWKDLIVMKSITPLIEKIKFVEKHNIEVPIITNYEEYLTSIYGLNWRIPDPKWKDEKEIIDGLKAYRECFKSES